MPAENHEWTLSSIGRSEGHSTGNHHLTEGQISFHPNFNDARQAVPTNAPTKFFDTNPGFERTEVTDPVLPGDTPEPNCGYAGIPLDFNAVAPDRTQRQYEPEYDLEGVDAPPSSGTGVLFRGRKGTLD